MPSILQIKRVDAHKRVVEWRCLRNGTFQVPAVDESVQIKVEEALEKTPVLGGSGESKSANEAESEIAAFLTDGYKSKWQSLFSALFSPDP